MRKLVIRFAEFVCLLALIGAVIYAYYLGKQTESGILYAFLALLVGSVSIAGFLCLVEIAENSEKAARQPDLDSDTQLIVMPLDEGELRILVSSPIRVEIGQKEIGGKEFYAAIMLTTTRIVLLAHGRKIELRRKHLESKQVFSDGRLYLLHQGTTYLFDKVISKNILPHLKPPVAPSEKIVQPLEEVIVSPPPPSAPWRRM